MKQLCALHKQGSEARHRSNTILPNQGVDGMARVSSITIEASAQVKAIDDQQVKPMESSDHCVPGLIRLGKMQFLQRS